MSSHRKVVLLLVVPAFPIVAFLHSGISDEVFSKVPKYGSVTLQTASKVRIEESETDGHFMFRHITDIAVDSKGDIFVLDDGRVSKFGPDGAFRSTIGGIGQGPGEYESPLKVFVDAKDDLYLNDQGRALVVFGPSGKFLERIALSLPIPAFPFGSRAFIIGRNRSIYSFTREYSDSGPQMEIVQADPKGKVERIVARFPETSIKFKGSAGGGVLGGFQHHYSQEYILCAIAGRSICFADNTEYRLYLAGPDGMIRTVFGKIEEPRKITGQEKKAIGTGPDIFYPPNRPFIKRIVADEEGRIYVIRRRSILDEDRAEDVDIFGEDGTYLYRSRLPFLPAVIRGGVVYGVLDPEQGKARVEGLRITNYSELRAR